MQCGIVNTLNISLPLLTRNNERETVLHILSDRVGGNQLKINSIQIVALQ